MANSPRRKRNDSENERVNETGRKNFRTTRIYFPRFNAEISEKLKVDMKEYCLIEQYSWHYFYSFLILYYQLKNSKKLLQYQFRP